MAEPTATPPRVWSCSASPARTHFGDHQRRTGRGRLGIMVPFEPPAVTIGPVLTIELERVDALELLGMALAHLGNAEAARELSPRVPLLMAIRDKLAAAL